MLDYDFLLDYEIKERNIIKRAKLETTTAQYITSAYEMYPDIRLDDGAVYLRGDVPLKLLLLLYDKIIIFMPPANRDYFEKKYNLPFDDFLTLCRKGIVVPLIAHPTDYTDNCFRELFELNPPSVWARGISLLNTFNLDFDEAQRVLPLKRIAAFANVRKQWRRHYPFVSEEQLTENIVRELSTLYADLIVFGFQDVANNLVKLNIPDCQLVYYLKVLNEILTYPNLFGLGGTPVFDHQGVKEKFNYSFSLMDAHPTTTPEIVCPSLKYVLEDFDIYFSQLTIKQLMDYHRDNLTKKMRTAIKDLQQESQKMLSADSISIDNICEYADKVNNALYDFHKQVGTDIVKSIKCIESNVNNQIALGGLTLGNYLVQNESGQNVDISYLSVFDAINTRDMLPKDLQRIISSKIIVERFSPSVASLWEIHNTVHEK